MLDEHDVVEQRKDAPARAERVVDLDLIDARFAESQCIVDLNHRHALAVIGRRHLENLEASNIELSGRSPASCLYDVDIGRALPNDAQASFTGLTVKFSQISRTEEAVAIGVDPVVKVHEVALRIVLYGILRRSEDDQSDEDMHGGRLARTRGPLEGFSALRVRLPARSAHAWLPAGPGVMHIESTKEQRDGYILQRTKLEERSQNESEIVRAGLTRPQKELRPILFYDAEGSRLFEEICKLPSYYVTRAEDAILREYGPQILSVPESLATLYELGSGSSLKTEHLVRHAANRDGRVHYVATDISEAALVGAAERMVPAIAGLNMHLLVASYEHAADLVHREHPAPQFGLFVGGNIGNFPRGDAAGFLRRVGERSDPRDRLMVGYDLVKDPEILVRAYDDPEGVTAAFNLNALVRINHELGGDFDLAAFRHEAIWNEKIERIEMHLRSTRRQTVKIDALELTIAFEDGETIHTENSHKYTDASFAKIASEAGWTVEAKWTDPSALFRVVRLAPSETS